MTCKILKFNGKLNILRNFTIHFVFTFRYKKLKTFLKKKSKEKPIHRKVILSRRGKMIIVRLEREVQPPTNNRRLMIKIFQLSDPPTVN